MKFGSELIEHTQCHQGKRREGEGEKESESIEWILK